MNELGSDKIESQRLEIPKNPEVVEVQEVREVNFSNKDPRIMGREIAAMIHAYLKKSGQIADHRFIGDLLIELETALVELNSKDIAGSGENSRDIDPVVLREISEDLQAALKRLENK